MYKLARPLFLFCETPLHAGSGDALGVVDQPIQRERHTCFPKIEASGLKGSIREAFEERAIEPEDAIKVHRTFGYDGDSAKNSKFKTDVESYFKNKDSQNFAGSLGFSDARLLLFPIKSMKGVFAWITCPRVLKQLENDLRLVEEYKDFTIHLSKEISEGEVLVANNSTIVIERNGKPKKIVLEEYTFSVVEDGYPKRNDKPISEFISGLLNGVDEYIQEKLKKDIIIVSNDDFKDFVNLSTEVITRTKISNKTGTVQAGALFTEEYLPQESVLYSLVFASPEFRKEKTKKDNDQTEENLDKMKKLSEKDVMEFFSDTLNSKPVFQIGGNASLGKGIVRSFFTYKTEKNNG
jgi:CRISPR-associated protein Cmr4